MNWFKNLNATPRLMSSFGVLLVLTLGISYLAIDNLSKSNDRVQALYKEDMKGVIAVQNIALSKLDVARLGRDAIIKIDDPAAVSADIDTIKANYVSMHSNLQAAELCFYTKEGKEMLASIRDDQPKYEQAVNTVIAGIETKDAARAKASLLGIASSAAQMTTDIDKALKAKEAAAEEKFQLSVQAYQTSRTVLIGACILSLVLGIILSIVIARGFSVPLGHAVIMLERVADGDLTARSAVHTKDEVGRMAAALNRAVEKLDSTLQEVAESATSASSSSQQLAAASEAIASGAQEQAASLEETSASLEEITAAVRQSSDNANQASQLASSSKDSALQGQEVVANAITAMTEINTSSAKISDIISTIDEIAFQTNLLAVNAAVEAARAGDEGRGFAVVASEVRSLAQRSAVAAKEIKVLIQDSLRKVEAGSGLVNRSGETLQGIVGSVKRVTDIVGEIAAASGEQSTGIEQVNTAVTQMDQVTQSNSAQTEELSATAQSLAEQAAHLMELVGTFTLTQGGRDARDRQAYQPRETNSVHSMAASLIQTARPNIVRSTPHISPAPQSSQAAQHSGKAAHSTAPAKPASRSRGGKGQNIPAPALAMAVAGGSGGSEASFEEF
jgi:methyl-accepting chemotaxis protein